MRRHSHLTLLPVLLTIGNGLCGFAAIVVVATARSLAIGGTHLDFDRCLLATGLLLLAMLFDLADGWVARRFQQTSQFGAELDSLCDLISFGIAPAVLLASSCPPGEAAWLWPAAAVYVICTALRLARFNVEQRLPIEPLFSVEQPFPVEQLAGQGNPCRGEFSGLPSPAAAGAVATLVVICQTALTQVAELPTQVVPVAVEGIRGLPLVQAIATLLIAGLMLSRFPYPKLPLLIYSPDQNLWGRILGGVVLVTVLREWSIPLAFWVFAVIPPALCTARYFGNWLGLWRTPFLVVEVSTGPKQS